MDTINDTKLSRRLVQHDGDNAKPRRYGILRGREDPAPIQPNPGEETSVAESSSSGAVAANILPNLDIEAQGSTPSARNQAKCKSPLGSVEEENARNEPSRAYHRRVFSFVEGDDVSGFQCLDQTKTWPESQGQCGTIHGHIPDNINNQREHRESDCCQEWPRSQRESNGSIVPWSIDGRGAQPRGVRGDGDPAQATLVRELEGGRQPQARGSMSKVTPG